ncbi:hypothetical protein BDR26DRAFT_397768 [Obelidium mucronatum]|nr:hypothetical protein BDR26DRAFT_397768 [Obelidium mucronatum]
MLYRFFLKSDNVSCILAFRKKSNQNNRPSALPSCCTFTTTYRAPTFIHILDSKTHLSNSTFQMRFEIPQALSLIAVLIGFVHLTAAFPIADDNLIARRAAVSDTLTSDITGTSSHTPYVVTFVVHKHRPTTSTTSTSTSTETTSTSTSTTSTETTSTSTSTETTSTSTSTETTSTSTSTETTTTTETTSTSTSTETTSTSTSTETTSTSTSTETTSTSTSTETTSTSTSTETTSTSTSTETTSTSTSTETTSTSTSTETTSTTTETTSTSSTTSSTSTETTSTSTETTSTSTSTETTTTETTSTTTETTSTTTETTSTTTETTSTTSQTTRTSTETTSTSTETTSTTTETTSTTSETTSTSTSTETTSTSTTGTTSTTTETTSTTSETTTTSTTSSTTTSKTTSTTKTTETTTTSQTTSTSTSRPTSTTTTTISATRTTTTTATTASEYIQYCKWSLSLTFNTWGLNALNSTAKVGTRVALDKIKPLGDSAMFGFDSKNKAHIKADPSLCIGASKLSQGNSLILVPCGDTRTIVWKQDWPFLEPQANPALCMDDYDGHATVGNTVGLWRCHDKVWNQQFIMLCPATTTTTTETSTTTSMTTMTTTTTVATTTTTTATADSNALSYMPLKQIYTNPTNGVNSTFVLTTVGAKSIVNTGITLGVYSTASTSMFAYDSVNRLVFQANPTLCVSASCFGQGCGLKLLSCTSTFAIRWSVTPLTIIVSSAQSGANSQMCLDKSGKNAPVPGAGIQLFPCNFGWNQLWTLNF